MNGPRLLERTIGGEMNPFSKKSLPSALKRVQRSKASNHSFRQALEQNLSTEELPPSSVPGEPLTVLWYHLMGRVFLLPLLLDCFILTAWIFPLTDAAVVSIGWKNIVIHDDVVLLLTIECYMDWSYWELPEILPYKRRIRVDINRDLLIWYRNML